MRGQSDGVGSGHAGLALHWKDTGFILNETKPLGGFEQRGGLIWLKFKGSLCARRADGEVGQEGALVIVLLSPGGDLGIVPCPATMTTRHS